MHDEKGKIGLRFPSLSSVKNKLSPHMNAAELTNGKIFAAIVGFSAIWTLILAIATRGGIMPSIFHRSIGDASFVDTFMDFFNSIHDSANRRPYTDYQCIYPPLTYAFYYFFARFFPSAAIDQGGIYIRYTQAGFLISAAYTFFTAAAAGFLVYITAKGGKWFKIFLAVSVCFSAPFLFQYERGNIIIISLVFLMLFIWLKDSENPIIRDFAIVSLAIAAAIKLYPAVFGLLLVKEKRWKDCLRCAAWGLVLFLLPFVFFEGFTGLTTMLGNIINTSGLHQAGGYGIKVNYANTLSMMLALIGFPTGMLIDIFQYVSYLIGALLLFSVFIHRSEWKMFAALSLFMVGVPAFSFLYTLILMAVPLIAFLNSEEKPTSLNNIYLACFVGMFIIIPYSGVSPFAEKLGEGYVLHVGALLHSLSVLLMTTLLIGEAVQSLIKARNSLAPAMRKYVLAAIISAGCLAMAAAVFVGYKAYNKVNSGYLAPIDRLLDAHGVARADTDFIFSRARWIRLLWGIPDSGAPDPSAWDLDLGYLPIKDYFASGERPFVIDKTALFPLMERSGNGMLNMPFYWDELFGGYEAVDSTERFVLFLPKKDGVAGTWNTRLQIQEITGVQSGGIPSEGGYLLGDRVVGIQVLNLSGETLPVEFQIEADTRWPPSAEGEDSAEGMPYKNVWMGLDNENYDYWSDRNGHISISEEIVLSPGLNMITLCAESGEDDLSPEGSTVHMYLTEPTILPRKDKDLEAFLSELESRGVNLEDTYGILKYPHLLFRDGAGKKQDSYFNGVPDYDQISKDIGGWNGPIIMDLYSIKIFTGFWNDLFWHTMEGFPLAVRVGDYFYFEPAGLARAEVDYDDFIMDNYVNLIRPLDKESMYAVSRSSDFSAFNPYGGDVEVEMSFSVKSYMPSVSRLFLDISGTRFNIPIPAEKEAAFRETVTLKPGANRIRMIIDGERRAESPLPQFKYEIKRQELKEVFPFSNEGDSDSENKGEIENERAYSVLNPDAIDSRDEVNLREGITWEILESAYCRIDEVSFRVPK